MVALSEPTEMWVKICPLAGGLRGVIGGSLSAKIVTTVVITDSRASVASILWLTARQARAIVATVRRIYTLLGYMLKDLKISVIGAGAMGEAIIGGLLRQELVSAEQVLATDLQEDHLRKLQARYGIQTGMDNVAAIQWGQIVIFAVKPQHLKQVLQPLRGLLRSDVLVISIVAGVTISTFATILDHPAVVRSMPNTPAMIGEGMTVWTTSAAVGEQQRGWARAILGALGHELFVDNENYLDMSTALNGSGPAYFFLMMEAMIDAGVHMGLSRPIAQELVLQTMLGSVRYAQQSGMHPAQLRNAVTSPGGTTSAALSELERGGIRTVLSDAIWAAYRRSVELGKQG